MKNETLEYKCNCGGVLKKSQTHVEFFGIDFGIKKCEICANCGSEYLDNEVLYEIEQEVKKRKLFGLERQGQITKSGNSLVVRIPPEIIKFSEIKYKENIKIYPISKNKIEIELEQS